MKIADMPCNITFKQFLELTSILRGVDNENSILKLSCRLEEKAKIKSKKEFFWKSIGLILTDGLLSRLLKGKRKTIEFGGLKIESAFSVTKPC